MPQTLTIDHPHEHVAHVQLNRPDVMNALDNNLINDLCTCFDELDRDEQVRVILLSGAGKAFCAGGDIGFLNYINQMSPSEIQKVIYELFFKLAVVTRVRQPVLAVLHGYVLGAGLGLSLLCDIRLASENAKFGAEFPSMGIIPELGLTYTLPALVGLGKALELALSARRFNAEEALNIGLISRMVREEKLFDESMIMARQMAQLPPLALRWTKSALRRGAESTLAESFERESQVNGMCFASEDHREAASAFLEKRKPVFKGR